MAFVEDFTNVLCLDVHLQLVLNLVHHNLVGIALLHIHLEVTVCCLRAHLSCRVVAARQVECNEGHDGDEVYPVHVELGHIHLRTVIWPVLYVVLVHFFFW